MYIFLDESYNLKNRSKLQFISINGFKVINVKKIWKRWKIYRWHFVGKARIHATDKRFEKLREKSLHLLSISDASLLTVFQEIREIPVDKITGYYRKGKLNFEKVYEDMLKALFKKLNLQEYKVVTIVIDSRKHKGGILGKKIFRENILAFLRGNYKNTIFCFEMQLSSSNILLEVADFISNSFFKKYSGQYLPLLDALKIKTIEIKNPLGKPKG